MAVRPKPGKVKSVGAEAVVVVAPQPTGGANAGGANAVSPAGLRPRTNRGGRAGQGRSSAGRAPPAPASLGIA
jgi:hypothetical protein